MADIQALRLEDILSPEEISAFHSEWDSFRGKDELAEPYEVHNGLPVISKVFQFRDKPIFRARVFQGRNHLRKINPYHNAPFYLMPFWHIDHFWRIIEQLYHSSMEKHRPHNHRYLVKDIPQFDLKEPAYWPSKVQGHVSATGIHRLRKGSWEKGKALELFTCHYADDKTGTYYGSSTGLCFVRFRSYFTALQELREGKKDAGERLIRIIENQDVCHKYLEVPRSDIAAGAPALIDAIRRGELPEESVIDNFFSLYTKNGKPS